MRQVERDILLRTLDQHWREHLAAMDYLRQGIHLRGYAQKDYRYEFKREAFELFTAMLGRVKFETASMLAKVEVRDEAQVEREEAEQRERLMRALVAEGVDLRALQHQAIAFAADDFLRQHSRPPEEAAKQRLHVFGGLGALALGLFMAGIGALDAGSEIGDDRKAGDFQTETAGDDRLRRLDPDGRIPQTRLGQVEIGQAEG